MGLALLKATKPDWFTIHADLGKCLLGRASILFHGAATEYELDLKIADDGGAVFASERVVGHLPASCPERHINPDGTFCTQYDASSLPGSRDGARVWWGLLREYLGYQRIAGRTRRWPREAYISHGEAGKHHLLAREAAKSLGLEEAYREVIRGGLNWINDGVIKVTKDGTRLLNGRAACPIGCKHREKRRLRRKCCKKGVVLALMNQERLRVVKEQAFWDERIKKGAMCCRTMDNCPLTKKSTFEVIEIESALIDK